MQLMVIGFGTVYIFNLGNIFGTNFKNKHRVWGI